MHEAEPNVTHKRTRTFAVRYVTQVKLAVPTHAENLGSVSYVHIPSVHELIRPYTNVRHVGCVHIIIVRLATCT